jgi:transcriptional regulator with AAA-type ATPase domain
MALLSAGQRCIAEAVSHLMYCNPFLPERIDYERDILGRKDSSDDVWSKRASNDSKKINELGDIAQALVEELHDQVQAHKGGDRDIKLYADLCLYLLYDRYRGDLQPLIVGRGDKAVNCPFAAKYTADFTTLLIETGVAERLGLDHAHLLACFFQVRRAFHFTYEGIIGASMPTAVLRAAVWQSIFTCDMRRYQNALYNRLGDITTLIVGPSGTGKELVARAIGLSRYIAFDPKSGKFVENFSESFYPLNLSALSPTLIESELFGHCRGAFTGALQDRPGWLEVCPSLGAVFLDEIGEITESIQVKLLRVLESRVFQRLGDTEPREFHGKLIAATNRDLALEMEEGRFRTDFYYRLCSDIILTPSLCEQLQDAPGELEHLVRFLVQRVAGDELEDELTADVLAWIKGNLGENYPWTGNVRELEQCVRNIMIRKEYHPLKRAAHSAHVQLAKEIEAGLLTADELHSRYCTIVYARTGNYEAAARQLELDRRTVKSKVDEKFLEQLKGR